MDSKPACATLPLVADPANGEWRMAVRQMADTTAQPGGGGASRVAVSRAAKRMSMAGSGCLRTRTASSSVTATDLLPPHSVIARSGTQSENPAMNGLMVVRYNNAVNRYRRVAGQFATMAVNRQYPGATRAPLPVGLPSDATLTERGGGHAGAGADPAAASRRSRRGRPDAAAYRIPATGEQRLRFLRFGGSAGRRRRRMDRPFLGARWAHGGHL